MFVDSGLFHQMWNLHIEDTLELNTLFVIQRFRDSGCANACGTCPQSLKMC